MRIVLGLLFSLLLAAPAGATSAWTPTQQLSTGLVVDNSEGVPGGSPPAVGVDATGAALVVWSVARERGKIETDVFAATAPAGGAFGPARVVVAGGENPQLAVLPDGKALMTVVAGQREVLLAGRVDGTFAPPQPFGDEGEAVVALLPVPQGALAVTGDVEGERPNAVRDISPDGAVGAARAVGLGYDPGALLVGGGGPGAVARGTDGTLAFPTDRTVTVRRPDGTWQHYSNRIGARQSSSEVAVAPDGRIGVVAITRPLDGETGSYGGVGVAELTPGAKRFGRPRALPVRKQQEEYTRDRPRPFAVEPTIAYDRRGRRVVAWIEDTFPDPGQEGEAPIGRVIAYRNGKRSVLDRRAANVILAARGDGLLALSDLGAWRSWLLGPGAPAALSGPAGTPMAEAQLAVAPSRTVLAWRGRPDGGIRVAMLVE
jgi:hypothetical protein